MKTISIVAGIVTTIAALGAGIYFYTKEDGTVETGPSEAFDNAKDVDAEVVKDV